MSAYVVFTREKTLDQAELEIYWQKVAATFAGHTVKLLAQPKPGMTVPLTKKRGNIVLKGLSTAAF